MEGGAGMKESGFLSLVSSSCQNLKRYNHPARTESAVSMAMLRRDAKEQPEEVRKGPSLLLQSPSASCYFQHSD